MEGLNLLAKASREEKINLSDQSQKSRKRYLLKSWFGWTSVRRIASYFFMPVLFLAALFLLFKSGRGLDGYKFSLNIPLVVLSLLLMYFGLFIAILIWKHVLSRYGIQHSFLDDVRIYNYSALALLLPGGIWSMVSRSALYQRLGSKSLPVAAASVVETISIGIASLGVYFLAVILQPEISILSSSIAIITFSILVFVAIQPRFFIGLINWVLKKRHQEQITANFGLVEILFWVTAEMFVIIIGGGSLFILLTSLTPVSIAVVLPVIAAWSAASAIANLFFFLPGTPFIRDGAMVLALTTVLPPATALLFVLVSRIWSIFSLLLAAGLSFVSIELPEKIKARKN